MSEEYEDMNDDELEKLAMRALKYRQHITNRWPTVEAVLHGMVSFWIGVQEVIGERNANRAGGMYFRMYGTSLMEETGGCDEWSVELASGKNNLEKVEE